MLIDGITEWGVWKWHEPNSDLFYALSEVENQEEKPLILSEECKEDIISRFQLTIDSLNLPESAEVLMKRFIKLDIIGKYRDKMSERIRRKRTNNNITT